MLKPVAAIALAVLALTGAAHAQDVAKGESEFKKCRACHEIVGADGTEIVKGGKTGPNLFGVVGRAAGTQEGFSYSEALKELNASGEVWTEADLAAYITDPNSFVREKTGDAGAKTKMTFKLNKSQADVAAYLASLGK